MKFYLIDRVIEQTDDSIVALKALTNAEEYLDDHFPGFPVMPGVMMLETLVQAARRLIRDVDGPESPGPLVVSRSANATTTAPWTSRAPAPSTTRSPCKDVSRSPPAAGTSTRWPPPPQAEPLRRLAPRQPTSPQSPIICLRHGTADGLAPPPATKRPSP